MKVKMFYGCLISILFCLAAGCNPASEQELISRKIGIDVASGTKISSYDTHGGWLGDGVSCVALEFSGDGVLRQIEDSQSWEKLPASQTVEALIYGVSDATGFAAPILSNQNGGNLIPRIEAGYYRFIDRYDGPGKDQDILERKAFNFTVAVYDIDDNVLYFGETDT